MALPCASSKRCIEESLQEKFREACGGKNVMSYEQFVTVTQCRSELFAKRLFEAMHGDNSGDITFDEFVETIHVLQSRDSERRRRLLFDLFDLNRDGVLTGRELRTALYASLEEGDVSTSTDEREELVSSLMHFFGVASEEDTIGFEEFSQTMEMYPDMLEGFSLEGIAICRARGERQSAKTWRNKVTLWVVNHPQGILTYSLLTLTLLGCFYWRFQRYMWICDDAGGDPNEPTLEESLRCRDSRKRELMGWCLPIAKGAGQAMKAVFTLILIPVSRNLMTNLRSTFLKYFFNFDASIDFHKVLGTIGFALAWMHTLCHVSDLKRWSDPDRRELYFRAFPQDDRQPSFTDLLSEQVAVTGILLITIYSVAALFALDYPKKFTIFNPKKQPRDASPTFRRACAAIGRFLNNFNHFWYTHHLFAAFYVCLVLHPKPAIPHERYEWAVSDSWVWVLVPAFIYILERLTRFILSDIRDTSVLSADTLPGNVVELKIMKPRGLVYVAGQYVFLNCPQLSRFEWHPFTLTSSPGDSYLSVHIRVSGDWTQALYDSVKKHWKLTSEDGAASGAAASSTPFGRRRTTSITVRSVSGISLEVIPGSFPFKIKVDGPFGAPSQNYKDYKVIILIGAGIGVTPFASVLNDLLDIMQNHRCAKCGSVNLPKTFNIQKVYFYWTVRSRKEAAWFKHVLEAISFQDDNEFIDINIHITSFRRANDLRVMLLRLAQQHGREQHGIDPLAGIRTRAVTNFGRPNWQEVFQKVKKAHNDQTHHCGVFYCGPNSLAQAFISPPPLSSRILLPFQVLREETRKHSSKDMMFELNTETFG